MLAIVLVTITITLGVFALALLAVVLLAISNYAPEERKTLTFRKVWHEQIWGDKDE